MTRSKTGWLFLGSALVLTLTGGTPAVYADGGDPTLIHACVNKSSGGVKIVGASSSCETNEYPLDWSIGGEASDSSVFAFIGIAHDSAVYCASLFGASSPCSFAVEALQVPLPKSGKLVMLALKPYLNTTSAPVSVTVLVNGAVTALTTSVSAGSTAVQFLNAEVPVVAGDLVVIQSDQANSGEEMRFTGTLVYE